MAASEMPPYLLQVSEEDTVSGKSLSLPESQGSSDYSATSAPQSDRMDSAEACEWSQHTDFLGRQYYVHKQSGTRQWANPADWMLGFDENGYKYAYNSITGESKWVSTPTDETPKTKRNSASMHTGQAQLPVGTRFQERSSVQREKFFEAPVSVVPQPNWLQSPGKWSTSSGGSTPAATPDRQPTGNLWSWWGSSSTHSRPQTARGRVEGAWGSATASRLPGSDAESLARPQHQRRRARTERAVRKARLRLDSNDDSSSIGADSESETLPRALLYDGFNNPDDDGDIESGIALPQLTTAAVLTLQDNPNFIVGLSLQDRVEWLASALVGASSQVIKTVAEHGAAAVNKLLARAADSALPIHASASPGRNTNCSTGGSAAGLTLSPTLHFLDSEAGCSKHASSPQMEACCQVSGDKLCDELQQLQMEEESTNIGQLGSFGASIAVRMPFGGQ